VVLFLPAHDEQATVASVVGRVPERVGGHPVRCLVVDDGSGDRTAGLAEEAGALVLGSAGNQGLGAAVRRGLQAAMGCGAVAVAFCDADGEYDPGELERLVAPILEGRADYVVGSRFAGEIRRMLPHRRLGNRLLTRLLAFVARAPIGDGQSGFRALSRAAAADAEILHDYNYAQVLTLDLLAKGYRYLEVPIGYSFRSAGRSFVRPASYLRRVLPAVWRELNGAAGGARGRPQGAAAAEAPPPGRSSSSRLGAARIDGLSMPQMASTRPNTANRAIVARAEVASSRAPAASGPSGAVSSEIVAHTDSARPSSRSGVSAIR
jgi:glycosyltransferase involved in cell wall biosynthesis